MSTDAKEGFFKTPPDGAPKWAYKWIALSLKLWLAIMAITLILAMVNGVGDFFGLMPMSHENTFLWWIVILGVVGTLFCLASAFLAFSLIALMSWLRPWNGRNRPNFGLRHKLTGWFETKPVLVIALMALVFFVVFVNR